MFGVGAKKIFPLSPLSSNIDHSTLSIQHRRCSIDTHVHVRSAFLGCHYLHRRAYSTIVELLLRGGSSSTGGMPRYRIDIHLVILLQMTITRAAAVAAAVAMTHGLGLRLAISMKAKTKQSKYHTLIEHAALPVPL